MWQLFIHSHCWMVLHLVLILQFIYPFCWWWKFVFFSSLAYYMNRAAMKFLYVCTYEDHIHMYPQTHSDFTDATKVFLSCYPQQHAYPQSARVLGVLVLTSNPRMSYHSWMFPFIKYLMRLCLIKSFIFNFKKYCHLFLIVYSTDVDLRTWS